MHSPEEIVRGDKTHLTVLRNLFRLQPCGVCRVDVLLQIFVSLKQVHLCSFNQRGLLLALDLFILWPKAQSSSTHVQADTNKQPKDAS